MKKKDENSSSSRISRNLVEEILRLLDKTFSQMKIFSSEHKNVVGFSDQLFSKLEDFLNMNSKLEIGIEEFSFTYEGETLYTETVINRSLPFLFFKDGLQRLYFFQGLDADEFRDFLDLIKKDSALPAEQSDIVSSFWERDFNNIRYFAPDEYLDTRIGVGMDSPEYEVDRTRLFSGRIELDQEDREALLRVSGAPSPGLDSPERAKGAHPEENEDPLPLSDLNEGEIEQLRLMIEANRTASPDDELLSLLFEIIYLEERREPLRRTLVSMKQCLDKLFEKGEFQRLAETVSALQDLERSGPAPDERAGPLRNFLEDLRTDTELARLRDIFRGGRVSQTAEFLRYLRLLGPGAIPLMGEMYDSSRAPHRREEILDALRDASREDLGKLLDITGNDKPDLTCRIIRILGAGADPRVVPLLASLFKYQHHDIREETIRTLGNIGDASAGRILAAFLNDPEEDLRTLAVENMPASVEEDIRHRILDSVEKKEFRRLSSREKSARLRFLARSEPGRVVPILERLLASAGLFSGAAARETAKAAVGVLQGLGTPESARILEKGNRHGHRALRKVCRQALAASSERRSPGSEKEV